MTSLFLFSGIELLGQTHDLKFRGQQFTPVDNLDAFIMDPQLDEADYLLDRYYRVIQFHDIPSREELRSLESSGIRLLDYLPNNAYFAALAHGLNRQDLRSTSIRSIFSLSSEIKTSLQFSDLPIGKKADLIEITFILSKDLNTDQVRKLCKKLGLTPKSFNHYNNSVLVSVSAQQVTELASLPFVLFVEPAPGPGTPDDTPGGSYLRSNLLDSSLPGGRRYDGSGVAILCRDDGEVFAHADFKGRLFQPTNGPNRGNHGDGVSGIMAGAGNINPRNKGMAAGSRIFAVDYVANFMDETMDLHFDEDVIVTNSSYSDACNAGYTNNTRIVDEQCYDNPTLMHVFSAGNANGQDCGYGAGTQWGNITGGHKQGKNVIATANTSNVGNIIGSSSRGPAFDGRIKPDISSNGDGHLTTTDDHAYRSFSGTSGAAPGIAGLLAQLHQAYRELNNGETAEGALLKAVLLNTANDLGNKGPDFIYGWGSANGYQALRTLEERTYLNEEIENGQTKEHVINVPTGIRELRIMTYWPDPAAVPQTETALINDLDSYVAGPNGTTHLPWLLNSDPDPIALNTPAERGVDKLNNMEQVFISDPTPGEYTLNIVGTRIPFGVHEYYVVYEFRTDDITIVYPHGGEKLRTSQSQICYWDAVPNGSPVNVSISYNGGTDWIEISEVEEERHYEVFSSSRNITKDAIVRLSRDQNDFFSEPFTISPIPVNLKVDEVRLEEVKLVWDKLPEAISYDVYKLGEKYMEVANTTTDTSALIPIESPFEQDWFAVAANFDNDIKGLRSNAEGTSGGGLFNFKLDHDLTMNAFINPGEEHFITCSGVSNIDLNVELKNNGILDLSDIVISYQVEEGDTISETYTGTLAPDSLLSYTFTTPIPLESNGELSLRTWCSHPLEQLSIDDTLSLTGPVYLDSGVIAPVREDFEQTNGRFPEFWRVINPDSDISWVLQEVRQLDGRIGTVLSLPFENYAATRQEDILELQPIDLSQSTGRVSLNFDMAYFYNAQDEDGLRIEVSTDCGTTFPDIIFEEFGAGLNSSFTSFQFPQSTTNWTRQDLDLSAYAGLDKIIIRLISINDRGNNLFLDNINIEQVELAEPQAQFDLSENVICRSKPVNLIDKSDGGFLNYQWDFGLGALPGQAESSGPHEISYIIAGEKQIILTTTNEVSSSSAIKDLLVIDKPTGGWTFEETGDGNIQFKPNFDVANSYNWHFGDGSSSNEPEPLHHYDSPGFYNVTLTVTNQCGFRILSELIDVSTSSVSENLTISKVRILPNPSNGQFTIWADQTNPQSLTAKLTTVSGAEVWQKELDSDELSSGYNLENQRLTSGLYFLILDDGASTITKKITIVD